MAWMDEDNQEAAGLEMPHDKQQNGYNIYTKHGQSHRRGQYLIPVEILCL